MRHIGWLLAALAAGGCFGGNPAGDSAPAERSIAGGGTAFGNVQPHHVYDPQYHDALLAYGPRALLVCNASLDHVGYLDDLQELVGPEATLLANDPSSFVPAWAPQSDYWNAYRAALDPASVGLPDSAWYWLDEQGFRKPAPRPCRHGGWCGEYWPGWALKPDTLAYRALADFFARRLGGFDGLWLDEWAEGFANYRADGLGIPREQVPELAERWRKCRRIYVDHLRARMPRDFLLVPNLQPARTARYPSDELRSFDGHTAEFPDIFDFARFATNPSPWNVGWTGRRNVTGWTGWQGVEGVVRRGHGLPVNGDP